MAAAKKPAKKIAKSASKGAKKAVKKVVKKVAKKVAKKVSSPAKSAAVSKSSFGKGKASKVVKPPPRKRRWRSRQGAPVSRLSPLAG